MPNHTDRETRPHCYRCDKPASMCICARIEAVGNTVGVHVLQHPRERRHPLGTARLLRLGLEDVSIHVLSVSEKSAESEPVALPVDAGLLYPADDARDLATLTPDERPSHLVVIDGTWTQAHRLYRDNPWIHELPRYRLPEGEPSRYRIRKEPALACLSTIESVVASLRILQPGLEGTGGLIAAFETMIDEQIAAAARRTPRSLRSRVRRRGPEPIPSVLKNAGDRLVVVQTEGAPRLPDGSRSSTPLRICAATMTGDLIFDQFVRTATRPDAFLIDEMDIEESDLERCLPVEVAAARFHEYLTAVTDRSPILVAWEKHTHRWLQTIAGNCASIFLKGVWCNMVRRRVPEIGRVTSDLNLPIPAEPAPGRAGRRLAHAVALTRHVLVTADRGHVITVQLVDRDRILDLRDRVLLNDGSDRRTFSRDLAPTTRHWAALVNGVIVGCVSLFQLRGLAVRGLAVAPEYRRQGVATRLMQAVHEAEDGPMWCNARLRAVPFYRSLGWKAEGPVFDLQGQGVHQRMTRDG